MLDNSRYQRSSQSASLRRDVLWNVSDPGDPYDIKKSMIARLPGDKKPNMGEHLDLVCLFQAAEIQRLCQFLQDYRLKFRQIERSNLDRHSYQVQIKQLSEQLSGQENLRNENSKLKQFSKKLQIEINSMMGQSRDKNQMDESLKGLYNQSLERVNQLVNQNGQLRNTLQELRFTQQNFNAKIEAFQLAKNRQIADLKFKYEQYSKETLESNLNTLRNQYQNQARQFELQIRSLKQKLQSKNRQIVEINSRFQTINLKTNTRVQSGNDQELTQLRRQIAVFQNRFAIIGEESERLSMTIRDYNARLQEAEARKRQFERRIQQFQSERRDFDFRITSKDQEISQLTRVVTQYEAESRLAGQSKTVLIQYESKVNKLNLELEQLNSKLRYEIDNSKKYRQQRDKLMYEASQYKLNKKDSSQLQINEYVNQINNLRKRIAEFQNKTMISYQQIERLNSVLRTKESQAQRYAQQTSELNIAITGLRDNSTLVQNKYQLELNRLKQSYERQLLSINQSKGNEVQSKIQLYHNQLQRLKLTLSEKNIQSQKLRYSFNQLQNGYNRLELQNSTKLKNYQLNFAQLKRQNEEFVIKIRTLGEFERKSYQLETRIKDYQRQFQNLKVVLRNKDEEIGHFRNKYNESEGLSQRYEIDASRKITNLQQNSISIRNQNQLLKRQLTQSVNQVNNLKRNIQRSRVEYQQLRKRLSESQQKLSSFYNESNTNIRTLSQENQALKRQLNELNNGVSKYEREVNNRISTTEQTIVDYTRQNTELKRKLSQYEGKLALLSQEMQRMNQQLHLKNQQLSKSELRFRKISEEYEFSVRGFKEYQSKVNNQMEGDIKRKFATYEQNIQNLNLQKEDLRRRFGEAEDRYAKLRGQHQRLNQSAIQQIELLKRQMTQKEGLIVNFEGEFKNKISLYEANLANLTKINEDLQRKLLQLDQLHRQKVEQINRLNLALKNSHSEHENNIRQFKQYQFSVTQKLEVEVQRKYAEYEQRVARLTQENQELKRRLNELTAQLNRKLGQGQNSIQQLSMQYQRMKVNYNNLARQNQQYKINIQGYEASIANYQNEVKRRILTYEENIKTSSHQNQELRNRLQEIGVLSRKASQYEVKTAHLAQQIQRLNAKLAQTAQENQALRRQLNQTNVNTTNYHTQTSRIVSQYEKKTVYLTQELEKLGALYKTGLQENQGLKRNLNQINISTNNYQNQASRKVSTYEQRIATYQQRIVVVQKQGQELRRRLIDYENSYNQLTAQFERTNAKLQALGQQNEAMRRQLAESQSSTNNYQIEVSRQVSVYEQNIVVFKKENEELKRRLQQYEQRLVVINQQYEKVTIAYRTKSQQTVRLESRFKEYDLQNTRKLSNLDSGMVQGQRQRQELIRKLQQFERRNIQLQNRFAQVSQQIQRLSMNLRTKNDQFKQLQTISRNQQLEVEGLRRKITEQEAHYKHTYQYEITGKFNNYEQVIGELKKRNGDIQLSSRQEIERLNNILRVKTEEYAQLTATHNNLIRQFEQVKRRVQVNQTNQGQAQLILQRENQELRRKLSELDSNSRKTTQDRDRKIAQYETKLGQLQKLRNMIRSKNEQSQAMMRQFKEYESSVAMKWETEVKGGFSQLNKQNQELKRRINQYENRQNVFKKQYEQLQLVLKAKAEELVALDLRSSQQIEVIRRDMKNLQYSWSSKYESDIRTKSSTYESNILAISRERDQLLRSRSQTQSKTAMLSQQLERVNVQLNRKVQENKQLSSELQRLKQHSDDRMQHKEGQFMTLSNNYGVAVRQIQNSKKTLQEYEVNIKKLYAQFERLQIIINQLKKERQSLHQMNHNLSEEINRLTLENADLQEQAKQVRLRLTDQTALQKRINEHLSLMVILFAEVETLRKRVKDKEKEVKQVRRSSLAPNIIS